MTKYCGICEKECDTVTNLVTETYKVRGVPVDIELMRERCCVCGTALGSDSQDQQILDLINSEYRKRFGYLFPDEIQNIRTRYNLSQKSFATILGMSEATINRYEKGILQEQTHDNLIRACENPQFVKGLIARNGNLLSPWQLSRVAEISTGQESPYSDCISNRMPEEISEQTGYRRFDYDKFVFAVVFFCRTMGEVPTTSINKLLFYCDFMNCKYRTVSITGSAYRKLQYGPALADYSGLLNQMEAEGYLDKQERDCGSYYRPGLQCPEKDTKLPKSEMEVLEFIAEKFNGISASELSDMSHKEDAWLHTRDREIISYRKAETLSLQFCYTPQE